MCTHCKVGDGKRIPAGEQLLEELADALEALDDEEDPDAKL